MEQQILVSHVNGAWRLDLFGGFEPLMFRTGGRAEAEARRLARRFAADGFDTRVEIRDRQNMPVGEHLFLGL